MSTIALTLDAGGAAGAIGEWVCRTATGVARATSANLTTYSAVYGMLVSAGNPGTSVSVCIDGAIPASLSGLSASAGVARVNGTTARAQRVASYGGSDYPIGPIDAHGTVEFGRPPASVGSIAELRSLGAQKHGSVVYVADAARSLRLEATSAATDNGSTIVAPGDGSRGRWLVLRIVAPYTVTSVKTADYPADFDEMVLVDPTAGGFTITAPSAVGRSGDGFTVKNESASANAITIVSVGGQTFSGAASTEMAAASAAHTYVSDGTNWRAFLGGGVAAEEPEPEPEDFHEFIASPDWAYDAADIVESGGDITSWPPRVGAVTLGPQGTATTYDADDGGYPAAVFPGGGRLQGLASLALSSGTDFEFAVRYRQADGAASGAIVSFTDFAGVSNTWAVLQASEAANTQLGQLNLSGGDAAPEGSETLGTGWLVGFLGADATTIYMTFADGTTTTAPRPAGTGPLNRIQFGHLVWPSGSLWIFQGAISHAAGCRTRRFTTDERADLAAWVPPA